MDIDAFHDSHKSEYRSPFGAAEAGTAVTLALDAPLCPEGGCLLVLRREGESAARLPMARDSAGRFSVTLRTPEEGALLWYYFALQSPDGETAFYGDNPEGLGGPGGLYDGEPPAYQITVYEKAAAPDWFKNAVVYQIFPDRFFRGIDWERRGKDARRPAARRGPKRVFQEDWGDAPFYTRDETGAVTRWPFFGGTLSGIREKLPYLKSLGVGAIYLNPVFEAASNHKYDTADYLKIDPGFGDEGSFRALVSEAEELGIRLVLDGVFAHTGADSRYFDKYGNYGGGACQGTGSPYYHWYRFEDFPHRYESWWGVSDLPKTDKNNPGFREFILGENGVARRWLRLGAKGWRLDVADELPDAFIRDLRRAAKTEAPDSVLIGEVWEDASNKISYGIRRRYLLGRELDSATNYPFRTAALDFFLGKASAFELARRLTSLKENYPPENLAAALNLIGGHDSLRALTVLGEAPEDLNGAQKEQYKLSTEKYELAKRRLKLLSLLQFTLPGVPCVYYGDEAGMQGFEDPHNRGPFPWGAEDGALLAHYRRLGLLRGQFELLRSGAFFPEGLSEQVFALRRRLNGEELLVLVNRGVFEAETVSVETGAGYALELLSSEERPISGGRLSVTLEPLSGRAFYLLPAPPARENPPRSAGVLCHLGSLPAAGEVPTPEEIFRFIDFLADSGQKIWQLLPLNPAGKGDSPFYSPALFALDRMAGDPGPEPPGGFEAFCETNRYWLEDYALFAALSDENGGAPWQSWPEGQRNRRDSNSLMARCRDAVPVYMREQYRRRRLWEAVRAYAKRRGVALLGDLPIYAAPSGADVWARRDLFLLDGDGNPALRAGVPPDYFSETGQDWGNPLYAWDRAGDGVYTFWENRLRRALDLFDAVRVDHFRAFSAYFAIPAVGGPKGGHWLPGPGPGFFTEMRRRLGRLPLIAEDLGLLDADVYNLLKLSGLPGMAVWQFSAREMETMPPEEAARRVFYSGTHDNRALLGWCAEASPGGDPAQKAAESIEKLYASPAPWVILPLQDILGLGDEARMNTPGTADQNWRWRASPDALSPALAEKYRALAEKYGRL